MSAGSVSTGGVVSVTVTVTVNDPEPVFPWLSVAVQLTVVVPLGKVLPEGGLQVGVSEPSTVSEAVGAG
jgi:hypothetical protein